MSMLRDLVERLRVLTYADQERVWTLVENWAASASDADKAALREKIRVTTLSRRAALGAKKGEDQSAALNERARAVYEALQPDDVVERYAWLFRGSWVDESADELEDINNIDFERREGRIARERSDAMREVYDARRLTGLMELATTGNASWVVGLLAASEVLPDNELGQLISMALRLLMEKNDNAPVYRGLVAGALRANITDEKRRYLLTSVGEKLDDHGLAQLYTLAPYRRSTWRLVDTLGDTAREKYWQEVIPDWIHNSEDENNESVERFLRAGRPRAAFSCVRYKPEKLDAQLLFRILSDAATGGRDKSGEYIFEEYSVERAFKHINESPVIEPDNKAMLEFAYLEILAKPFDDRSRGVGIPNFER
ncbi:hypothetical protein HFN45_32430 [Rhizobium leguminosarum]|nr:hypothetical protein [Rhizobium leguminosarum]